MRWLVGVVLVASACGLSKRHDAAHAGAAGRDVSSEDDAGRDTTGGAGSGNSSVPAGAAASAGTSAAAGAGGASGASDQVSSDTPVGAGGTNVRAGSSEPHGMVTATGGVTSTANAGAGRTSGTTPAAAGHGGMTEAGGASTGSAGATPVASAGGCNSEVIPSTHALHFEGSMAYGEIYLPLYDATENGAWTSGETYELWFRTRASFAPLLVASDDENGGAISITVVSGGLCFHQEVANQAAADDICSATRTLNDGAWHHAALSITASRLQAFEDGVLVLDKQPNTPFALPVRLDRIDLGLSPQGVQGDLEFFAGDLDEVRVWAGVRSPDEIAKYRATELCTAPNAESLGVYLFAYYPLDQSGDDTTIPDESGVPHSGELNAQQTVSPWITPGAF